MHKNNPDIVVDPTKVAFGGQREEQRKQIAADRGTVVATAKVAPGTKHGDLEESMMETKAMLMKQNINILEMEGIEKQLNLMEKFKSSFDNVHGSMATSQGASDYDMAVCDLLGDLPFMKKCKAAMELSKEKDNG